MSCSIELILLTKLPKPIRPVAARLLAAEILKVVRGAPQGARFGVHLCYGDLNHEAMGAPKDAGALVLLSNAITSAWPEAQQLEFVHAPFARGAEPPPLDPAFYAPLASLRLPESVRFVAGFVHEGLDLPELVSIRDQIEDLLGNQIDVAASCGLGRRDQSQARRNLELSRQTIEAG